MSKLALPALAWALAAAPWAQAGRIRRAASAEAQREWQESGLEVVSIPMRTYRKDCWKRRKRRFSLLEYPGAGLNLSGPFEEVLKDGYFSVDCMKDYMYEFGDKYGNNKFKYNQANISGVSIVHYGEVIPRENREKMTHDVCFRFCRTIPDMMFFGIKNGNDCYCAPYYKAMAGDSDVCDVVCEGDQTVMCGSKTKSNVFEMHLCAKTGKELADTMETMGESAEELELLGGKVLEAANSMQFAAASLQLAFSQRDYVASDQMQAAKVYAGKLLAAVKAADKLRAEMTELDGKGKAKEGADFSVNEEINEAEEITMAMQKAITAGAASAQELESLLASASPTLQYNETTPGEQYRPVMYFVDKEFVTAPSTCGGTMVGSPKVGTFDACAEACDFEVGQCVGFNYFANTTDAGLCVLFSKLKSAMYYTGCKEANESAEPAAALVQGGGKSDGADPFDTRCVAKLADFEGTTLKPDPSGKCDMCLKEAEEARKCYTEYAKQAA